MESKYDFVKKYRDQVLRCGRCGFCQAVCPVFGATLRPALNARGKMLILKELMDGRLEPSDDLIESLFQCTTCASCANNCPSGVCVPDILKAARQDLVNLGTCHPAFKGMNEVLKTSSNIYSEDERPDFGRPVGKKASHVFFIGCVGAYREDEPTTETLDLLDRLKVDYTLVEEVCCTGVLEDVGFHMSDDHVRKNIELIRATGAKTIITGCPYCFRTFTHKQQYAPLLQEGIGVVHISQFLSRFDLGVTTDKKVTYHDPCDLGRHCGIYDEPRQTIKKVATNFVEMSHSRADSLCCGAGGGVRGAYPQNSLAMARRRLDEAEATGAEIVLTECNSCVHNLSNAKLRKQKFQVMNTTQFLNQLMAGKK